MIHSAYFFVRPAMTTPIAPTKLIKYKMIVNHFGRYENSKIVAIASG